MNKNIMEQKESPAVIEHIRIMQSVILRMAENSARCKTWCVTLLAALIALTIEKYDCKIYSICIAITVLFFFLDSYYLGLERSMRKKYSTFVDKVNNGEDVEKEIYYVSKPWSNLKDYLYSLWRQLLSTVYGMVSFSTFPFYCVIILLINNLK